MKPTLILLVVTLLTPVTATLAETPVSTAFVAPRTTQLQHKIRQAYNAKPASYVPRTEHLREDGSPRYTNRLILEDSPYLLQHAHNPVDWHAWGEQAFALAKAENKPVFLSIGYSTCHWCHVMERESFEDAAIADFLNRHFIAIKVDRERRPDVDEIYMNAVRLMTGDGGWPMSGFLTADGKPFHGGTYFRPQDFLNLLHRVAKLWAEQQPMLLAQSARVAAALDRLGTTHEAAVELSEQAVEKAVSNMLASHDDLLGGFGSAPKFPREPMLLLLLNDALRNPAAASLKALRTTLDAMASGGIYDQVGGGFHRYSTDDEWYVPHFEKMLYNQAQLARVYAQAWTLTGEPSYRRVATQTLDYVLRDMTSADGAFFSATDADSEGEEGKFFFWRPSEIDALLSSENAELAKDIFNIEDVGYHEDLNILQLSRSLADSAARRDLPLDALLARVDDIREQLYQAREQRQHPLRDEKILTAWNGMMIGALAEAGMLLDEPRYLAAAVRAAQFIWRHNHRAENRLWRVHFDGRSTIEAQQQDYAYLAEGLLKLYDASADGIWLQRARRITDAMLAQFWDADNNGFFMTAAQQSVTAMGRPRDGGNDNAMPSGNSAALRVLQMLVARTGNLAYDDKASATLAAFAAAINQRPQAYAYMLAAASDLQLGEPGALRYAAGGGIRIEAQQQGPRQVNVDIAIADGWHINSSQPLQDGLIPTLLSIEEHSGWKVEKIEYPPASMQKLGFQSEPLSLYQGNIQIRLQLANDPRPARILPLLIGMQACNDRVCLPPQALSLYLAMQ